VPPKRGRRAKSPARRSLPEALRDPRCYGPDVDEVRLVETHISWVFLTGRYAYKVKKPVKLPFVDFSTLKLRKRFCDEELRVNRRFAPEIYRRVVPIGGTLAAPRIGRTPAFEYAVKMLEFPSDARLDRLLAANRVPRTALGELGARLAELTPACRACAASQSTRSAPLRCAISTSSKPCPERTGKRSRPEGLDRAPAGRYVPCSRAGRRGRPPRMSRRSASTEPGMA
jgi:hypothetical protein